MSAQILEFPGREKTPEHRREDRQVGKLVSRLDQIIDDPQDERERALSEMFKRRIAKEKLLQLQAKEEQDNGE